MSIIQENPSEGEGTRQETEETQALKILLAKPQDLGKLRPKTTSEKKVVDSEFLTQQIQVLAKNDMRKVGQGNWHRPAQGLYEYLWPWDLALISWGLAHHDWEAATEDLEFLFNGQWQNGMIPHIQFINNRDIDFYPKGDWWGTTKLAHAHPTIQSSGITQPPIEADMAWRIYQLRPDDEAGKKFLAEMYPKLAKLHQWMHDERDAVNRGFPGFAGLALILNPDESGMDDLTAWIQPNKEHLTVSEQAASMARKKRVLEQDDLEEQRPTDFYFSRLYQNYLLLKEHGYSGERIPKGKGFPFQIADPLFNTTWAKSNDALAKIARAIGKEDEAVKLEQWAGQTRKAINQHLWHEKDGLYYPRDMVGKKLIECKTVTSFTPLYGSIPPAERAKRLMANLFDPEYGFATPYMIPSTSTTEENFSQQRYWRGPVWPAFTNLFILLGMHEHKELGPQFANSYRQLRQQQLNLNEKHGACEYHNPQDGKACGATDFAPTAAAAIILTHEHY